MAAASQCGCEDWGLMERLWVCAHAGAPLVSPKRPSTSRQGNSRRLPSHHALAWVHQWAQPHPRALQASSPRTAQRPREMGWP